MKYQSSNIKYQNQNLNPKSTDLKIRAYKLSLSVIEFVNSLPNKRAYWSIGDQLIRSTTSIGANMIEARASSSKRDFIKYFEIALKSANETQYWLCLIRDSSREYSSKASVLLSETIEVSNMVGSSVLTLKGKRKI